MRREYPTVSLSQGSVERTWDSVKKVIWMAAPTATEGVPSSGPPQCAFSVPSSQSYQASQTLGKHCMHWLPCLRHLLLVLLIDLCLYETDVIQCQALPLPVNHNSKLIYLQSEIHPSKCFTVKCICI